VWLITVCSFFEFVYEIDFDEPVGPSLVVFRNWVELVRYKAMNWYRLADVPWFWGEAFFSGCVSSGVR